MSVEVTFSHRTGTLLCLQKKMATYRHWSVSLWRDPDDVSHCRILPWQNWMAAYLGYTLRMKTLFRGWPVMVNDTHTRRRKSETRLTFEHVFCLPVDHNVEWTVSGCRLVWARWPFDSFNFGGKWLLFFENLLQYVSMAHGKIRWKVAFGKLTKSRLVLLRKNPGPHGSLFVQANPVAVVQCQCQCHSVSSGNMSDCSVWDPQWVYCLEHVMQAMQVPQCRGHQRVLFPFIGWLNEYLSLWAGIIINGDGGRGQ